MKFNIIRILLITCLLSSQVGIWAQTKSITGTVCDTNGEMIIGANVTVKGTTKGTITNVYGIYTVSATPKDIIEKCTEKGWQQRNYQCSTGRR